MSNKSTLRNINLSASVDLTGYGQDIHDYEGFSTTNSLFMNKRLMNWWKRAKKDSEIISGVSWEKDGDNFIIKNNNKKVMSISNKAYKLEEVESIPEEGIIGDVPRPIPTSDKELGLVVAGLTEDKSLVYSELQNANYKRINQTRRVNDFAIIGKAGYVYIYDTNDKFVTQLYFGKINNYSEIFYEFTLANKSTSTITLENVGTLSFPEQCVIITQARPVTTSQYISSSVPSYYKTKIYGVESKRFLKVSEVIKITNASIKLTSDYDFVQSTGSNAYLFMLAQNGIGQDYFSVGYCTQSSSNGYVYDSDGRSNTSLASDTYLYFQTIKSYDESSYKQTYINGIGLNTSGMSTATESIYLGNIIDTQYSGFSIKYGEFAINYTDGGEFNNIGHNYKKIYELPDNPSIWYSENEMYIVNNDTGKIYKLSIVQLEKPEYKLVGNYYIIFNTTTYINAFCFLTNYTNAFCSCDDWNCRAIFNRISSNVIFVPVATRLNNEWQVSGKIESVSTQYPSVRVPISQMYTTYNIHESAANFLSFIDGNYTCPDETTAKYTIYFASEVDTTTSTTGAMYKRGYIYKGSIYSDYDKNKVWTDSEDSVQEIPPLLGASYAQYADSIYVMINNFNYKLLNFTTSDHLPFLVYLYDETGYNTAAYTQFVINGQIYTYYPNTNKIIDSNDTWVADTSLLTFIGYSTVAAFFYSKFDKNMYVFTGDNTLKQLASMEKANLKETSLVDEFGNIVFGLNTLNIPSHNIIIFNLTNKIGIMFENQFCIIDVGEEIKDMNIDLNNNNIIINNNVYSFVNTNEYEVVPIEFETEFYGAKDSNNNVINDTVYLTVSNTNGKNTGRVIIESETIVNQKINKTKKKIVELKQKDFNSYGVAMIKYQPEVQECYGFKLYVKSDFEIADMKIGTTVVSAENQTTNRI